MNRGQDSRDPRTMNRILREKIMKKRLWALNRKERIILESRNHDSMLRAWFMVLDGSMLFPRPSGYFLSQDHGNTPMDDNVIFFFFHGFQTVTLIRSPLGVDRIGSLWRGYNPDFGVVYQDILFFIGFSGVIPVLYGCMVCLLWVFDHYMGVVKFCFPYFLFLLGVPCQHRSF